MIETKASETDSETINRLVLQEAFEQFSKASATLEASYKDLQVEARRLSIELASANAELQRTLDEKERVKNYLKNILHSLNDGVVVVDSSRNVQVANPAASRLLQIPRQHEGAPQSLNDLTIAPHLKQWMNSALSTTTALDDFETCVDFEAGESCHLIASSSPLAETAECESGVAFILKDVTRLKELELKAQRDHRLQAMGEMAVELAHEIRNPLGSIELFASLLADDAIHPQAKRWADQIVIGVKFMNTIVTNMLTFTRSSAPQFRTIDIVELVEGTLLFLNPIFEQRELQIEKPNTGSNTLIEGDPEMIRQMLINLVMNALRAMPERGRLSVRVTTRDNSVQIEIEDTGIGIPEENLSRIFDPFFTTSETGTGLGLSLVHQIVEKHHGTVTAASTFGKGSCFSISLPRIYKGQPAC